jgi:hypothetical protein
VKSHELERLRRSLAMLPPQAVASSLNCEQAMALTAELAEVQARLERLRGALREVLEQLEAEENPGAGRQS